MTKNAIGIPTPSPIANAIFLPLLFFLGIGLNVGPIGFCVGFCVGFGVGFFVGFGVGFCVGFGVGEV